MAQRRMFSKDITGTDAFLEMPVSSQLLYFHLGMEADDDGFVGSPKKVSRMIGAGEDDLKVLSSKRFILPFESGVVVIKHWKINNYIQSDRYHETKYLKEKKTIITKENGSYTECIQNSNKMDTEVRARLGKSKSNIATKVAVVPFNSNDFIDKCCNDKQEHIRLIGNYMKIKKMNFPTKKTADAELRRNLKIATLLKDYPPERRKRALMEANKMTRQWTLETVLKYLNK